MHSITTQLKDEGLSFPDYKNSNMEILKEVYTKRSRRIGDKSKKIFMVVDGLGYNLIQKIIVKGAKPEKLPGSPEVGDISTVFPSTTPAVIASIESGTPPSEHGINAWQVYMKEIGAVILPFRDSLAISKNFRLSSAGISSIFPEPELLKKIAKRDKTLIQYSAFVNKDYGEKVRNSTHKSHVSDIDMLISIKEEVLKEEYGFIYAYHDMIDGYQHRYGSSSEAVRYSVMSFFNNLEKVLIPALKGSDYNLIITADHGTIEGSKKIKIRYDARIMDYMLMPPWGDSRIRYAYAAPGKEKQFESYFEKKYGKYALLINSEDAIKSGIFGSRSVKDKIRARFGTHVIIMKGNTTIEYSYPVREPSKRSTMLGYHSGLTEDEMRVPLMVY